MSADAGRWADLRPRVISAVVMIAVAAVEIWLGGPAFALMVLLVSGAMIWELARITRPKAASVSALILAALAVAALAGAVWLPSDLSPALLLVPALGLALTPRRDRRIASAYAVAVMVAGYGLVALRDTSAAALLWLICVVVASDVLGYFAGRIIGGPKFWPAVSPKKTWSGTAAGWLGAVLVGVGFVLWAGAPWGLVALSPVAAFAGQMGDIAESWIKRRAGVKDSSNLIPGHGGFLDRFDALILAAVAVMALGLLLPLPLPGGGL